MLWTFYNLVRNKAHVIVVLRSFVEEQRGGPSWIEREAETACAMRVAGATWEQWQYPDIDPDWAAIRTRIEAVTREADLVIAPAWEEGGHEHHNTIAALAEETRRGKPLVQYLSYIRGQGRSDYGTEVVPTLFEQEQKRVALSCYASQMAYAPTAPWFGDDQREFVAS